MAKTKLLTRAQSANWLHEADKSKTALQWNTFLNDNSKPRVKPEKRIPYERTIHNIAMYRLSDLETFITQRKEKSKAKAKKAQISRLTEVTSTFGLNSHENRNSAGQYFGYVWKGASVNLIADNAERGAPDAVSIQLQINHPLRVSALTTVQAEAFAKEILDAVQQAKRLGI